jgi:hypothetical protein
MKKKDNRKKVEVCFPRVSRISEEDYEKGIYESNDNSYIKLEFTLDKKPVEYFVPHSIARLISHLEYKISRVRTATFWDRLKYLFTKKI